MAHPDISRKAVYTVVVRTDRVTDWWITAALYLNQQLYRRLIMKIGLPFLAIVLSLPFVSTASGQDVDKLMEAVDKDADRGAI